MWDCGESRSGDGEELEKMGEGGKKEGTCVMGRRRGRKGWGEGGYGCIGGNTYLD